MPLTLCLRFSNAYIYFRRQTLELTRAYNDLNTEYEAYKENNGSMAVRNQDLVQRIGKHTENYG